MAKIDEALIQRVAEMYADMYKKKISLTAVKMAITGFKFAYLWCIEHRIPFRIRGLGLMYPNGREKAINAARISDAYIGNNPRVIAAAKKAHATYTATIIKTYKNGFVSERQPIRKQQMENDAQELFLSDVEMALRVKTERRDRTL